MRGITEQTAIGVRGKTRRQEAFTVGEEHEDE